MVKTNWFVVSKKKLVGTPDTPEGGAVFFFPVKKKTVPVKKPEKTLKSARENKKVPVKFFIKFCP